MAGKTPHGCHKNESMLLRLHHHRRARTAQERSDDRHYARYFCTHSSGKDKPVHSRARDIR